MFNHADCRDIKILKTHKLTPALYCPNCTGYIGSSVTADVVLSGFLYCPLCGKPINSSKIKNAINSYMEEQK